MMVGDSAARDDNDRFVDEAPIGAFPLLLLVGWTGLGYLGA